MFKQKLLLIFTLCALHMPQQDLQAASRRGAQTLQQFLRASRQTPKTRAALSLKQRRINELTTALEAAEARAAAARTQAAQRQLRFETQEKMRELTREAERESQQLRQQLQEAEKQPESFFIQALQTEPFAAESGSRLMQAEEALAEMPVVRGIQVEPFTAESGSRLLEAEALPEASAFSWQQIAQFQPTLLSRAFARKGTQQLLTGEGSRETVTRVSEGALLPAIPKPMRTDIQQVFFQMFKDLPKETREALRKHMYEKINKDLIEIINEQALTESEAAFAMRYLKQETNMPLALPSWGQPINQAQTQNIFNAARQETMHALPAPKPLEALPSGQLVPAAESRLIEFEAATAPAPKNVTSLVPFSSGNVQPALLDRMARGEQPFAWLRLNPSKTKQHPNGILDVVIQSPKGPQHYQLTNPQKAAQLIPKNYHQVLNEAYKQKIASDLFFWRQAAPISVVAETGRVQELTPLEDFSETLEQVPVAGLLVQGEAQAPQALPAPSKEQPGTPQALPAPSKTPQASPEETTYLEALRTRQIAYERSRDILRQHAKPLLIQLEKQQTPSEQDIAPIATEIPGIAIMARALEDQKRLIQTIKQNNGLYLQGAIETFKIMLADFQALIASIEEGSLS